MMMTNREIANILSEMAIFFDMDGAALNKGDVFKPRAYEKAAASITALDTEVRELYREQGRKGLEQIPGIGRGIADHLEELLDTGHFQEYASMQKKYPIAVSELAAVEGVGPKMIKILWEQLKIKNLGDLEKAARAGKIRGIGRFGEKSEASIIKGIEFLKTAGGRKQLSLVLADAYAIESAIRSFPETEKVVIAGSVRRWKETVGDIDIIAVSQKPGAVMERFVNLPMVAHVYGTGPTKTNVRLKNGLDADLRVVPKESYGAALNYFTGSKEHNVALREIALKKGWKLNEYGLYSGKRLVAGKTEEELYKKLELSYIEPELREMTGEIEAARNRSLPRLIGYGDLHGDLQVQTNWTDGADSIENMAEAAIYAGLEYIVITDHTKSLAMTGGLDEKKLLKQAEEIDRLNKKFSASGGKNSKFKILKGAEVNIDKNGGLDINDDALAKLDVVGASVHSHFRLSRAEETARIIRVMEHPHVDIIFHLTGRLLNIREPIDLDIDEIISAARRTGTILEINASPERLDIKDGYIRKSVAAGVSMSIDSDAHAAGHFSFLHYGIAQARRGWAEKKDIINTWPIEKMLKCLK